MNDILPKPFTKEGLLQMLEKHLFHLKKPGHLDPLSQPSPAAPVSAMTLPGVRAGLQTSVKEEESPQKSPATVSTWHSPAHSTVHGMSPVGSTHADDYSLSMPPHPAVATGGPVYGMPQQPPPGSVHVLSPVGQMGPNGMQYTPPGQPHRRHISEISGGEDVTMAKRQQMYAPMGQMGQMGRPR
jgi:osomolarity two-component system response regulator SKN7